MEETTKNILVITADLVIFTNVLSCRFMIEANKVGNLRPMPQNYGCLEQREGLLKYQLKYNDLTIFDGGDGQVFACGWQQDSDDEWTRLVFESMPSCTLLMNLVSYQDWKMLAEKYGLKFRHYHYKGILQT